MLLVKIEYKTPRTKFTTEYKLVNTHLEQEAEVRAEKYIRDKIEGQNPQFFKITVEPTL